MTVTDLDEIEQQLADLDPDESKPDIKKIRSEVRNLRSRVKPFEEAFDGHSDSNRDLLLSFVSSVGPKASAEQRTEAVRWMIDQGVQLAGENVADFLPDGLQLVDGQAEAEAETDLTPEETVGMTKEEIAALVEERAKAIIDERESASSAKREIEGILAKLGYDNVASPYARAVLLAAQEIEDATSLEDRLTKAHESLADDVRTRYSIPAPSDATTDATGQEPSQTAPPDGTAPAGHEPTSDDPSERMRARLDDVFGSAAPPLES